jgi:uncharacterized protein (TIGR03437 family)
MTGKSVGLWLCVISSLFGQNVAYVVDNALGQVDVIDLAQRRVSATIPSGGQASEMLILPNNHVAIVSNQADSTVAFLDLNSNQRMAALPVGQLPSSLIGSPDGRLVYVANVGSNDVTVIDVASRSAIATVPVDATPVQVNLSPDGRFVYVVNQDAAPTGTITLIDTRHNRVAKTLTVGLRPVQFAISPTQVTAYVINTGSDSVSVVDLSRNEVTATIPVGHNPVSGTFSTDGSLLYVVNQGSNSVSVVDTRANRAVTQIPVGAQPVEMVITFDSKFGYVSNQGSNSVSELDLTANTNDLNINVGNGPFDLSLDPNENFLYVTNVNSQSVSVIDVNTDHLVATIPVGGAPIQFTLLNAPTLLELAPNPVPAGGQLTLSGEGFLSSSTVRVITTTPPRTVTVSPAFLDNEGLQVALPALSGSSTASVVVDQPDGDSSETLTVRIGAAGPAILSGGVVEAGGFQARPYPISAGAFVAIFSTVSGIIGQTSPTFPSATTFNNVKVTFNGVAAPLYYVGPEVISALAPGALATASSARVALTYQGQTGPVETVNVAAASPGIFIIDTAGTAAAKHGLRPSDTVTVTDPAAPGETITLYLSGLGSTSPSFFDAEPPPTDLLLRTLAHSVVTIAGQPARVVLSGLTPGYAGLYFINLEVPNSAPSGPNVGMTVTVDPWTSNRANLAIK